MIHYEFSCEVSGQHAHWGRPDSGDTPVSSEIPSMNAFKYILLCIAYLKSVSIIPVSVSICSPFRMKNLTFNYRGENKARQIRQTILENVCYQMKAIAISSENGNAHAFIDIFNRRLKNQSCFYIPCLGLREFSVDYFGPFRESTKVCKDINMVVPAVPLMFNHYVETPSEYFADIPIVNGVANYPFEKYLNGELHAE